MKKIQKFLFITFSLALFFVSACAPVHEMLSANNIKSVYDKDFNIELIYTTNPELQEEGVDLAGIYGNIAFSAIPDIDTVFVVERKESDSENSGDSALIVIFKIPGEKISSDIISVLSGKGYAEYNKNVIICRFIIKKEFVTTENEKLNLDSPEIKALYGPLKSAVPDQKIVGF